MMIAVILAKNLHWSQLGRFNCHVFFLYNFKTSASLKKTGKEGEKPEDEGDEDADLVCDSVLWLILTLEIMYVTFYGLLEWQFPAKTYHIMACVAFLPLFRHVAVGLVFTNVISSETTPYVNPDISSRPTNLHK